MNAFYSLWDVVVGTSLGTYESEDAALEIVDALIHANGEDYARALDLGRHEDEEDDSSSVQRAVGDELLDRLREWRTRRLIIAGTGE